MAVHDTRTPSRFENLDPQHAADILRRRLMGVGGTSGGLMGVAWCFVSSAIFKGFPPIGTPPFYMLLFLAAVILGGSGMLVGRYFFTKIMKERERMNGEL